MMKQTMFITAPKFVEILMHRDMLTAVAKLVEGIPKSSMLEEFQLTEEEQEYIEQFYYTVESAQKKGIL